MVKKLEFLTKIEEKLAYLAGYFRVTRLFLCSDTHIYFFKNYVFSGDIFKISKFQKLSETYLGSYLNKYERDLIIRPPNLFGAM